MGRSNGKLIPFLRDGLMKNLYVNLNYEMSSEIFCIELPRYEKGKSMDPYEFLLKEWYRFNGNLHKYESYSVGKAVLQASLKKSVYLVSEPSMNRKLRFHFANREEIKENQRILKEKERKSLKRSESKNSLNELTTESEASKLENFLFVLDQINPLSVHSSSSGYISGEEQFNPPSVHSSSSGYISGEEIEESSPVSMEQNDDLQLFNKDFEINFDMLDDDFDFLNDVQVNKNELENQNFKKTEDFLKPSHELTNLTKPVEEITFTSVDVSQFMRKKTYWLCSKKVNLDSLLLLSFEKQVLEDGNIFKEGTAVIPNDFWEPGILYDVKKAFELNEQFFLFLSPRV